MGKTKLMKIIVGISLAVMVLSSQITMAANGAMLYQTKTCAACHGFDAKTPIMPLYPKLAGQNEAYAIAQMKDIKSGTRNNGQAIAMKGVMGMVSNAEMKAIARWLASLK